MDALHLERELVADELSVECEAQTLRVRLDKDGLQMTRCSMELSSEHERSLEQTRWDGAAYGPSLAHAKEQQRFATF